MAGADTIFALSSGAPPAAIGIIRVSGPAAATALEVLAGGLPEPRRAALRWICDGETGERLDRGLALWFPGPGSATGEDLAELHIHGGRSVAAAICAALGRLPDLRAAEAGEFTRRAFANGVIDLAEAEGLADLLAAETETQRRAALTMAGGALSRKVAEWQTDILGASAAIEAILDFGDEEDVAPDDSAARATAARVRDEIAALLARPPAERLRDGIRVVIAGPPNVGKSTLLNALVGREAAITSPLAGTTRDVIEAPVAIGGIPFLLSDTAGLRDSTEGIERIGIDRATASIAAADIVLWLGDADCSPVPQAIRIHPKCDEEYPESSRAADLRVSAKTGEGLEALEIELISRARSLIPREGEISANARQRAALFDCARSLEDEEDDAIFFAENLRAALRALDRVTGRAGVEDMLDALFGRFCIGK